MWQCVSLWSPAPYFLQPCLGLAFLLKGYSFQDGACRQCQTAAPQDGVAGGVSPALETGSQEVVPFPVQQPRGSGFADLLPRQWWGSDGAVMGTCQCHPPHAMGWPSALLHHDVPRATVLSNPSHAFLEMRTSASELLSAVKMGTDFS